MPGLGWPLVGQRGWRPGLCPSGHLETFRVPPACLQGSWEWGYPLPTKADSHGQYPRNLKVKISVSYFTGVSLSQSFTDSVSALDSCKIIPRYRPPRPGTEPSHLARGRRACMWPRGSLWAGSPAAHVFGRTGLQAFRARVLNPLVK